MKCIDCMSPMKSEKESIIHYTDCGLSRVYLKGISVYKCTNKDCDNEELEIPNLVELHEILAQTLARQETRLLPEEVRFLRTHLGFSSVDFAKKIMKVAPETISRWENGSLPIKETVERFLRVLVISKIGPFRNYEDLQGFGTKEIKTPPKRVFVPLKSHWIKEAA